MGEKSSAKAEVRGDIFKIDGQVYEIFWGNTNILFLDSENGHLIDFGVRIPNPLLIFIYFIRVVFNRRETNAFIKSSTYFKTRVVISNLKIEWYIKLCKAISNYAKLYKSIYKMIQYIVLYNSIRYHFLVSLLIYMY